MIIMFNYDISQTFNKESKSVFLFSLVWLLIVEKNLGSLLFSVPFEDGVFQLSFRLRLLVSYDLTLGVLVSVMVVFVNITLSI